jgi:hypothetical protein
MTDFEEWLAIGVQRGWVTEPFCNTHNGYQYLTDEQERDFDSGGDPCVDVIQLKVIE